MTFYKWLVVIGIIFWIAETWYFGWNREPQSAQEGIADFIVGIMIFWGVIGDVLQNVRIQKFNTTHNNINTKTVQIENAELKGGKRGNKKA